MRGVGEDEQAVGLQAELVDRLLERHRLGAGPADHDVTPAAPRRRAPAAGARGGDPATASRLAPFRELTRSFFRRICAEAWRAAWSIAAWKSGAAPSAWSVAPLAWSVTSDRWRWRSVASTTRASMSLGEQPLHLGDLRGDPASKLRGDRDAAAPGQVENHASSVALADGEPALMRRQDAELLAVLRDRPARDGQALLPERLGDVLVGERLRQISSFATRSSIIFLTLTRRDLVAMCLGDPAVEEELERQDPLRRLARTCSSSRG